jgi:S-DNA-T family DNA segregation ATPase FtsK/SpoIIIE
LNLYADDRPIGPEIEEVDLLGNGVERLTLSLPPGFSLEMIEREAPRIAVLFLAAQALVERVSGTSYRVNVTLLYGSGVPDAGDNPLMGVPAGSLVPTDAIPVGRDVTGSIVGLTLFERSFLLGGSPGSGKSVLMQQLVAGAALMADAALWLIDPKGGAELGFWSKRAARIATVKTTDATQALRLLEDLVAEMDTRYEQLVTQGRRKLLPGAETPLIVLVVEELAALLQAGDKKEQDRMRLLLRDVVQRGRAAAICPILVTQFPKSDVLDTTIRNQLSTRVALRCGRSAQSDTILGEDMSKSGADASLLPTDAPGAGFVVGETDATARLFRAFFLSDDELRHVARRASTALMAAEAGPAVADGDPEDPTHPACASDHQLALSLGDERAGAMDGLTPVAGAPGGSSRQPRTPSDRCST